jgi:hypothetical protein
MVIVMVSTNVLSHQNWLYLRIYRASALPADWKSILDWYHEILINVVKPLVLNNPEVRVALFGLYGPEAYQRENERYSRSITPPPNNVLFIRLRISPRIGSKKKVNQALMAILNQNVNRIQDYEVMQTYHVRNDLGSRYGSEVDYQTQLFIDYWNAACRYVLEILDLNHNWKPDVDVWGIPHLLNNSLGCWLRPERGPVTCPTCQSHMYMATWCPITARNMQVDGFPFSLFVCPNCLRQVVKAFNI